MEENHRRFYDGHKRDVPEGGQQFILTEAPTIEEMFRARDTQKPISFSFVDKSDRANEQNLSGSPVDIRQNPRNEAVYWILLATSDGFVLTTYNPIDREATIEPYSTARWSALLKSIDVEG